eukprot:NODE_778_length_3941_cov_1.171525.p1 type:complete len:807 gc:universal NODE_778_length_3941_cov_1.171525:913-3333(+)
MSYPRYESGKHFGIISDSFSNSVTYKKYIISSGGFCLKMYNSNSGNYSEREFQDMISCLSLYKTKLAIGFMNGKVKVLDMDPKLSNINDSTIIYESSSHIQTVRSLCIFEDFVCSAAANDIIVHQYQSQKVLKRLKGHTDLVSSMLCYKNESDIYLVSASKDTLLKIWSLSTYDCLDTAIGHRAEVWDLCISSHQTKEDLLYILSAGNDGINYWKFDMGCIGRSENSIALEAKLSNLKTTALVKNDNLIFTASNHKCIIYDLKKRAKDGEKHPFKLASESIHDSIIKSVGILTTVKEKVKYFVSTISNSLEINELDLESYLSSNIIKADKKGHRHEIRKCVISQDDTMIATASKSEVCIWNIKDRGNPIFYRNIDVMFTRTLIFVPGNQFIILGDEKGKILVVEIDNDNMQEFKGHSSEVFQISLVSDNSGIITCGGNTLNLYKFNLIERTESTTVPLQLEHMNIVELNSNVYCCAINDSFVAVSLFDNTIRLLYRDSLKPYLTLYGHNLPALSLYFMKDRLISGSADKTVRVWSLDFGDCRKILKMHQDRIPEVMELKHDGFLASAEGPVTTCISCDRKGNINYWDAQSYKVVQRFKCHRGDVTSMAAANHGDWFVSVGKDRLITFWNRTEDEVFLQEELDKELDERVEKELTMTACDGKADRSTAAIKAGERLLNSIEMYKKGIDPSDNSADVVFATLKKTPTQYLFDEFEDCKLPDLESALTLLKFDQLDSIFTFVEDCLDRKWNVVLVARIIIFVVKMYQKQLVRFENMSSRLQTISTKLNQNLKEYRDLVGMNLAVMSINK